MVPKCQTSIGFQAPRLVAAVHGGGVRGGGLVVAGTEELDAAPELRALWERPRDLEADHRPLLKASRRAAVAGRG